MKANIVFNLLQHSSATGICFPQALKKEKKSWIIMWCVGPVYSNIKELTMHLKRMESGNVHTSCPAVQYDNLPPPKSLR